MTDGRVFCWRDAFARLPTAAGEPFADVFVRGTLRLGFYAPRDVDGQSPHRRDELYVVISGAGTFVCDGIETAFSAGDALFAPAGAIHRFKDFDDDFRVWVMFYGPDGGEADLVRASSARARTARPAE